jgi:putative hydrolase of HD superfamily
MEGLRKVLELIKLGEKLKQELRHSWLSDGRRESVAEHTWRVSLMAMAVKPYLQKDFKLEKLLKMITIHDLVEAYARDIPAFDTLNDLKAKETKAINENDAIEKIRELSGPVLGQEIFNLWHEFEGRTTYEAKVANALDKLEAQIQHNEADINTWIPIEYKMTFMLGKHTEFDPVLDYLRDMIEEEGKIKMEVSGIDVLSLK